jgi:N-acetylmuramoyl-L-alanine amidase
LVGSAGEYTLRFTDRAGTYESSDDVSVYLGGATDIADAASIHVSAHAASVPAPFVLPLAAAPAADRIAGPNDCASAVAASADEFQDAAAPLTSVARKVSFRLPVAAVPAYEGTPTAVVTAAGHYPEAICAASLAGAVNGPVLLTKPKEFYVGIVPELHRLGIRQVYVVGSKSTVPERQVNLLKALGFSVERISGADRYAISANVARKVATLSTVTSQTPVFVASGNRTQDGFIVAPAAYATHGILLLVNKTTPKNIASVAKSLGVNKAYAVGDKLALPKSALDGLTKAGVRVTRGSASTSSYSRAANFATVSAQRGWLSSTSVGLVCLDSLAESLASPAALGRAGAPLLFVSRTSLPTPTAALLKTRAKVIDLVRVYSRASTVRTTVLLTAGSH